MSNPSPDPPHNHPDNSEPPGENNQSAGLQAPRKTVREELNTPAHERIEEEFEEACAKLEQLDYHLLGMSGCPSDETIANAHHVRSIWHSAIFSASTLLIICILGFLPAWLGGVSGALLFVLSIGYFDGVLPIIPGGNRYNRLLKQRQQLHRKLLQYVQRLEGTYGYIHHLQPLEQLNNNMQRHYFNKLCSLSRKGVLAKQIHSLENLRLYYEFLIEANNANQIRENIKLQEQMAQEHKQMADPDIDPITQSEPGAEMPDDSDQNE